MGNRTIVGFLSVLSGKVGVMLLGILITPILVRILGNELYGDYALLLSILAVITTITHAGISGGIRKFIAEERDQTNWRDHVFAFYARFATFLALGAAFFLIIFGRYGPVDALFGEEFRIYFQLLAVIVITGQLFYVTRYTLIGISKEKSSEPLTIIRKIIYGVIGLSLAYIGFEIIGILIGTAIAAFVCGIAATWLLRNHINLQSAFSPVPSDFPRKELIGFNVYNTVFILATISLYNVDILILQPIAGSQETGYYKAALVVAQFLWLVPQAVQIVFIHSASELWSRGESEKISKMASVATRFTLSLTLLLIIGLTALSSEFMTLYFGPDFIEAVNPLLLLLPGVLGFALARPIYAIGQGKGELRILIIATGAAAFINLILNLILIPSYGMIGAAVATSIGYGSMVIFHIVSARHIGFNPLRDVRLRGISIAVLFTSIFVFGTSSLIDSRIVALIVVPIIGLITYVTISIRLDVISGNEINTLERQLPDHISRMLQKLVNIIKHDFY